MTNYLNEAFQKLSLVEDDFNFSARDTGVADELKSFVADDIDIVDEEPIIDVEANSTDDLQASYVGKAVLECNCCHARIFRDKDKVIIDEETGLVNIDEACTVCSEKGWIIKGKVEEFEPEHEDKEEAEKAEEEVEETEEKPEKKAKKKDDEEDEEEVEESLKEAFEEAYGDCEDCGDDIPMEENAIMDRVRAKMELGESEEKFPDPSKHDYVKTVEGTKMYYCNDCGKYAAKIDGKKVKADSEEELEKKIKKGAGALKEGVNMNKLRRKLEMEEDLSAEDDRPMEIDDDTNMADLFATGSKGINYYGKNTSGDKNRGEWLKHQHIDSFESGELDKYGGDINAAVGSKIKAAKDADARLLGPGDRKRFNIKDDFEEAFDPERVRAKLEMGESCEDCEDLDEASYNPDGSKTDTSKWHEKNNIPEMSAQYNDYDKKVGGLGKKHLFGKKVHVSGEKEHAFKIMDRLVGREPLYDEDIEFLKAHKLNPANRKATLDALEKIAGGGSLNRRPSEDKESGDDSYGIKDEAFDPERVRAKMLGESKKLNEAPYGANYGDLEDDEESNVGKENALNSTMKKLMTEYVNDLKKSGVNTIDYYFDGKFNKETRDNYIEIEYNHRYSKLVYKLYKSWYEGDWEHDSGSQRTYGIKFTLDGGNFKSVLDSIDDVANRMEGEYSDHPDYTFIAELFKKHAWAALDKELKNMGKKTKKVDEALHVEADGEDKVTVDKADDGSMDIHVGPGGESDFPSDDIQMEDTEGLEAGDEMITPLSDEEEEEIKANTGDKEDEFDLGGEEEAPVEGEEEAPEGEESDENVEDFDEESFDNMGESYVRRVYEDVESYKTTNVAVNESQLVVEGLITMRSGATKPTKFVFGNATYTKRGKLVLEGMNTTFSNKKNAFVLKGTLTNGKFIGESMLYKYPAKALNESKQMETYLCSGRVVAKKK